MVENENASYKNEVREDLAEDLTPSGVEMDVEEAEDEDGAENQGENKLRLPFDLRKVNITTKVLSVESIVRRLKSKTINLAPNFQRGFVWNKHQQSRLIESLILKIPLPSFYVEEDADGNWEVVDGLQRLSTVREFVLGKNEEGKDFKLSGLEFLHELEAKTFNEISGMFEYVSIVNNIMEAQFQFVVILPSTPEKMKRNIFKRLNTGGLQLTDQEIRHALYQGNATEILKEFIDFPEFKKATSQTVNDSRMAGQELILRFIAFYLLGEDKFKATMDDFLAITMQVMNQDIRDDAEDVEGLKSAPFSKSNLEIAFKKGLNRGYDLFEDDAFRKSLKSSPRKFPINKALFEVWVNLLAKLPDDEFNKILKRKDYFLEKYEELLNDLEFDKSISRHASSAGGVKTRYARIRKLLQEVVNA